MTAVGTPSAVGAGTYYIRLEDGNGCVSSGAVVVTVNSLPNLVKKSKIDKSLWKSKLSIIFGSILMDLGIRLSNNFGKVLFKIFLLFSMVY